MIKAAYTANTAVTILTSNAKGVDANTGKPRTNRSDIENPQSFQQQHNTALKINATNC